MPKFNWTAASALVCALAVPASASAYTVYLPGTSNHALGPLRAAVATVPCRYPDGWNVGDAAQDFRGVPLGLHHRCRVTRAGIVVDRDGDPTQ